MRFISMNLIYKRSAQRHFDGYVHVASLKESSPLDNSTYKYRVRFSARSLHSSKF